MNFFRIVSKSIIYCTFLYKKNLIKRSNNRIVKLEKKLYIEHNYNTELVKDTLFIIEKYKSKK